MPLAPAMDYVQIRCAAEITGSQGLQRGSRLRRPILTGSSSVPDLQALRSFHTVFALESFYSPRSVDQSLLPGIEGVAI